MGFLDLLDNNYDAFVGYFVGGVFILLFGTYVLREFCFRRFGIDVCPGAAGSLTRARRRRQEMLDQQTAIEVQQALEEENRRTLSIRRREERRAKYEVFLKPYTMVVRHDDFFVPSKPKLTVDIESAAADSGDIDENEASTTSMSQAPETEDQHVLITLPVTTPDGKPRRVEASCSICLMEYQVGESVVWSTRKKCLHAFHDDCILTWLGKGKKRCPCCRHFFVPGHAVDDKPAVVDDGADETINEESDGENMDEAMDAAIIEEIRNTMHSGVDCEAGASPRSRRNSAHESRHTLPPEAETIVTTNTI